MSKRALWPTQYGPITPRPIFANLLKDVLRAGKCIGCGTCVAVCPANALQMMDESPRLVAVCIRCGYCYNACPMTTDDEFKGFNNLSEDKLSVIFGENYRKGELGIFRAIYKSTENISPISLAKEIMKFLLEKDYVDAIATVGFKNGFTEKLMVLSHIIPKPIVIKNKDELDSVCFWITTVPTGLALRAAADELYASFFHAAYTPKICYFAPPTHIRAIWRMRLGWGGSTRIEETVYLTLTVFGTKYYALSSLRKALEEKGVNINLVKSYEASEEGVKFYLNNGETDILLKDLNAELHSAISSVDDKYGYFADISIGKIGGNTYLIARSVRAEKIVRELYESKYVLIEPVEEV